MGARRRRSALATSGGGCNRPRAQHLQAHGGRTMGDWADGSSVRLLEGGGGGAATGKWQGPVPYGPLGGPKGFGKRVLPPRRAREVSCQRTHCILTADWRSVKRCRGTDSVDGQPYVGWANLPADLLDRVRAEFGDGGHSMIRVARLVNRHWCAWATQATECLALCGGQHVGRVIDMLAPKFDRVRRLKLKYPFGCDDRALARLAGFRSLTHLELQDYRGQALSVDAVASLATVPKLSKLHFCSHPALMYCNLTDLVASKLTACTALRELCLSNCQITDRGLAGLASLTGLSRLGLEGCKRVTDDGVSGLAALTNLTELDLAECTEVTARGAAGLAPLTALTKLGLLVNGREWGAGLDGLAGMRCLSELLLDADLTDPDMQRLGGLTSLRSVHLKWKWNCSVGVTDAGMAALARLTGLRELALVFLNVQVEGRVTDAGVRSLEALTALTSLIFIPGSNRVTDGALGCLRAMPRLADLRWGGVLTPVGLKSLGRLERLTALAVRVPLTYDVVRSLRPLTCL
ncbi:unnamed protein product, partial [Ostreobium quekettii]